MASASPSKTSGSPSTVANPARPLLAGTPASDPRKPPPVNPPKALSSTVDFLPLAGTTSTEIRSATPTTSSGQERKNGSRPSPPRPSTTTMGSANGTHSTPHRCPSTSPFDAQDVDVSRLTHEFWRPVTDPHSTPEISRGGVESVVPSTSSPYASSAFHNRKTAGEGKRNDVEEKHKREMNERTTCKGGKEESPLTEGGSCRVPVAVQKGKENGDLKGTASTEALETWPPSMVEEFLYPIEFMGLESLLFIAPEDRKFLRQEFV